MKPSIGVTDIAEAVIEARGIKYKLAVIDDDLDTDPTVLLFRGDEEEAVATIHLNPASECGAALGDNSHVIVRPEGD